MSRLSKIIGIGGALLALVVSAVAVTVYFRHHKKPVSMQGVVIRADTDIRKQSPIADVEIRVTDISPSVTAKSDFSGFFDLRLPPKIRRGMKVRVQFRHPNYEPLDLLEMVSDEINVVHLTSVQSTDQPSAPERPPSTVANVIVRYSIETAASINIGSEIATFEIENKGNVPCHRQPPCSPNGKWKAAVGSGSLDAGTGNVLDEARVSCIAGPCPFTKVISDGSSRRTQKINVSVLDWSDTATFLLQAEVYREQIRNIVRQSFPVIFGDSINYTLPPAAEGAALVADINNTEIVFPLGPTPILSWAICNVQVAKDQSKSYRCDLKPGYIFRPH
jgi:hypothetical protein